jgi:NitT/TauT family transport system permease protein
MTMRSDTLIRMLPAAVIFAGFIAVWQLAVTGLGVREYLLPSPLSVIQAMGPGEIPWVKHIWITAIEIVGAFLIAALTGVILGAAIAWSDTVARALTPFLVFVNTLPKVAVAPLFLIWLGYGVLPNMLIGALIGFFPVVINTAVGLAQIEQDMLDMGRVFNAPKWKVFAKIRMPNAYPYILSALKVTATAAVVGAVVGEFVGGDAGLGYLLMVANGSMDTQLLFAGIVGLTILGVALYLLVELAERLAIPRHIIAADKGARESM